jgi:hypothetical protein
MIEDKYNFALCFRRNYISGFVYVILIESLLKKFQVEKKFIWYYIAIYLLFIYL